MCLLATIATVLGAFLGKGRGEEKGKVGMGGGGISDCRLKSYFRLRLEQWQNQISAAISVHGRRTRGKHQLSYRLHCKEHPIYVFLYWELRGLRPNFHIHVSVSDLSIPRIGPHIFLQQNRQTDPGNI